MTRPRARRRLVALSACVVAGLIGVFALWVAYLDHLVTRQFEGRLWSVPARVYAEPMELYAGAPVAMDDLEQELRRLHYRLGDPASGPGAYRRGGERLELNARRVRFVDELRAPVRVVVRAGGAGIVSVATADGTTLPLFRLDPLLIGSISPVHGEDRIVLAPEDVPAMLSAALETVEDRRFRQHHGIDLRGILRAVWANLRAGHVVQGGSTLTQQLVKNYFLSDAQTFARKFKEALMALSLEARFSKQAILVAYVNEVFLGQDGERAIHGFGLGSEFYFGKPLAELDSGELALLVGLVKGPSYYDPRHHPERARERRDVVLRELAVAGLLSPAEAARSSARPLGIRAPGAAYVPAWLDLVRRHLKRDYAEADLAGAGLAVYTTLDPRTQAAAERALTRQLQRLEETHRGGAHLQGAVLVAEPQSGDVLAVVGGREVGLDGFNRALDAHRPIGSLVKPAIYLAALAGGRYTAASLLTDAPLELRLSDGTLWTPQNYTRETYGEVPLVRALAESMNLATVRLGLELGLAEVGATLTALGLEQRPAANPSLLLGALDLTPLEVLQLYTALANGGFRARLRAVRAVLDEHGTSLRGFPVRVEPAAPAAAVYALDRMLVQVTERGTGRGALAALPPGVVAATKTGTSSDTRDSWFAGFTGSHVAVVWVGYDDDRPTGLSGASGALPVWAETIGRLKPSSWAPPAPEGVEDRWIEYLTGLEAGPACSADSVLVALPTGANVPARPGCAAGPHPSLGERIKSWLQRTVH